MHRLIPIPPLVLCLSACLAACDAARTDLSEVAPPELGCAHSAAGTWEALSPSTIKAYSLRLHGSYLYAVSYDEGLWRRDLRDTSAAGGEWRFLGVAGDAGLGILGALDVWQDPLDPHHLLATARPDSLLGLDRSSAFRTSDGGKTWEDVSADLPLLSGNRVALCRLFEETEGAIRALGEGYVLRTEDLGETWETLNEYVPGGSNPACSYFNFNPIEQSLAAPEIFWTGTRTTAFQPYVTRSLNGGRTWERIWFMPLTFGDASPAAIALDPFDVNTVYIPLGWLDEVVKSVDGGASWAPLNTAGIEGSYRDLIADPAQRGRLWLGLLGDYDTTFRLYVSENGGASWGAVEVDAAVVDLTTWIADLEWDEREDALLLGTDRGVYRYRPAVDTSMECGP